MLFKVRFRDGMKVLDLGTGGGFPGIPLAIMLPACSFVLLDFSITRLLRIASY